MRCILRSDARFQILKYHAWTTVFLRLHAKHRVYDGSVWFFYSGARSAMARNLTVMVVDDDPHFADMVSQMLMEQGYNTVVCATFEAALDFFSRSRIHIIVTDIFMPGMGGIEGIQRLKADFPGCKIIAMTGGWGGMPAADAVLAAKKIDADGALQKPFTVTDIQNVLEALPDI
jgi:CheY-like chemotaxis protein